MTVLIKPSFLCLGQQMHLFPFILYICYCILTFRLKKSSQRWVWSQFLEINYRPKNLTLIRLIIKKCGLLSFDWHRALLSWSQSPTFSCCAPPGDRQVEAGLDGGSRQRDQPNIFVQSERMLEFSDGQIELPAPAAAVSQVSGQRVNGSDRRTLLRTLGLLQDDFSGWADGAPAVPNGSLDSEVLHCCV